MEALLNQAQLDEALASFTIKRVGFMLAQPPYREGYTPRSWEPQGMPASLKNVFLKGTQGT